MRNYRSGNHVVQSNTDQHMIKKVIFLTSFFFLETFLAQNLTSRVSVGVMRCNQKLIRMKYPGIHAYRCNSTTVGA